MYKMHISVQQTGESHRDERNPQVLSHKLAASICKSPAHLNTSNLPCRFGFCVFVCVCFSQVCWGRVTRTVVLCMWPQYER